MNRCDVAVADNDNMSVVQERADQVVCARNQTASDGNVVGACPETDGQGGNIMHNAMAYVTARCVSRALSTLKVVDQADSPSVLTVI